jgi:hypothetical protein
MVLLCTLLCTPLARAHNKSPTPPKETLVEVMHPDPPRCGLHTSGQLSVNVHTGWAEADSLNFVELQLNGSLEGLGLEVGYGYERITRTDQEVAHGGYVRAGLQWRPLRTAAEEVERVYRYVDPYLSIGGLLGGLRYQEDSYFRALAYVGTGLDIGLRSDSQGAVLRVGYRYTLAQRPDWAGQHLLVIGLGLGASG